MKIKDLEDKILSRCADPSFMRDLFDWAREKYSRTKSASHLLDKFHSRNLYFKFLSYVHNSNMDNYEIKNYIKEIRF